MDLAFSTSADPTTAFAYLEHLFSCLKEVGYEILTKLQAMITITISPLFLSLYSWQGVFAVYKFQGPVLSEMSKEGVIMLITKNTKTEVVGVRDIDMVLRWRKPSELTDQ